MSCKFVYRLFRAYLEVFIGVFPLTSFYSSGKCFADSSSIKCFVFTKFPFLFLWFFPFVS